MKVKIISTIEILRDSGDISFDRQGCNQFMEYSGTVEDVVDRLKNAYELPPVHRDLEFFLFANRLLIGVIDYGLRTKEDILELKQSVESLCMDAYKGRFKSSYQTFTGLGLFKEILDSPIVEKKDNISWSAFDPDLSRELIRQIRPKGDESHIPDFFILDGHDAYRPGLMIASAFPQSEICAIRNAQDSKRDSYPRTLAFENNYLKARLYNKDVMIIGEDVSTGNAISSLYEFVVNVSRPRHIMTAAPVYIPGDALKIPLDFFARESTSFG